MGKKIRVTPEELNKAREKLVEISGNYEEIYKQLLQQANTMSEAWEGADNLAFVDQINGFCQELIAMAKKISDAAITLDQQKNNYLNRQDTNITQVRKLAN